MEELEQRKTKVLSLLKKHTTILTSSILGLIILIGVIIRTQNLKLLKDKFLLALDPYLVYRYAEYIIEHGKLMALDTMRYVPLGYHPLAEGGTYVSYFVAYFYKFVNLFFSSLTLMKFDILYPVIVFIPSTIFFYLVVKRLFNYKVALLSTAFLIVLPAFLYRTMAGFSEKEPLGILLMFAVFYFFTVSWQSKNIKIKLSSAAVSGLLMLFLKLAWGGADFLFIIIPLFMLTLFLMNKFQKIDFYTYLVWSSIVILSFFIKGASLSSILSSFTTGVPLLVLIIFSVDFIFIQKNIFHLNLKDKFQNKLPIQLIGIGLTLFMGLLFMSILSGPSFLLDRLKDIAEQFIHPMGTSRFVLTVAEARQPFFVDWLGSFKNFFYLFFIGSIYMFYQMIKKLGNIKWFLTPVYALFISGFIFSRYSSSSILNGENSLSNFIYLGSFISFVIILSLTYLYTYYKNKEIYNKIKSINQRYIFIFIWFLLMVVAARGAMRLFLVFCPVTAILASNLLIGIYNYSIKNTNIIKKIIGLTFLVLVLLAPVQGSLLWFTQTTYNTAKYTGPSFNSQWQQATSWVKENTQEDAVFAHWWDYGYWVQTMWERPSILDGGNAISYWNHLMGRHVLTGKTPEEALEFLKSHDATHLLIISDEIGKYPAYASIGSDKDYDRYSYIPTFRANPNDAQETRNGTLFLFKGQFVFDEDFVYKETLFSKGGAIIGGFVLPVSNDGSINQPTAIIFNQGKRFDIPLNCLVINGQEKTYSTQGGLEGCLILVPAFYNNQVNPIEVALYVSPKTRNTLFAQMYLLNKQWPGFELVYEDSQNWPLIYSANNGRLFGPFKIWKINYPSDIQVKQEYLNTTYPSQDIIKSGQQFL